MSSELGSWRVYLDGHEIDLARLRRGFSSGMLVVAADEGGTYLQHSSFAEFASAADVLEAMRSILTLVNGMAALEYGGHRPVRFAGAIALDGNRHLFLNEDVRVSDDLGVVRVAAEITADGVVSNAAGRLNESGLTPMQRRLAAMETYPELLEVYRILGLGTPSWLELRKVWEKLSEAAGGQQRLPKRSGVPTERIDLLVKHCNDPDLTGDAAAHAVRQNYPPAKEPITLHEGLAIINEIIQGYVEPRAQPQ